MRGAATAAAALFVALAGAGAGAAGVTSLAQAIDGRAIVDRNGWQIFSPAPADNNAVAALRRAADALHRLGAISPEDMAQFENAFDADRRTLDGASRYVVHFDRASVPPVDAFWSLGLLDSDGSLPPGLDRHSVLSNGPDLARNSDGSLDVEIASTPPDDPRTNWLPAPQGAFRLILRAYDPRPAIREGRWLPPRIERRDSAA